MSAAAPNGDKPAAAHPRVLLEPRHPPPEEALNHEGAVDVTVRTHVMSLSSIDSHEQRFEALVWLQARAARGAVACAARGAAARDTRAGRAQA